MLTFAGTGVEEVEAQLGLAAIMLGQLLDGLRERLDSERNLSDRIGEVAEILAVAARCVASMHPASGDDRLLGEADCVVAVGHGSPSSSDGEAPS
jgi:hypothetical protein